MSKETKKYIKEFLKELVGNIAFGLTLFLLFN